MNAFAYSGLCVVTANVLMASLMFTLGKGKKINVLWGWVCLLAAIWGLGSFN